MPHFIKVSATCFLLLVLSGVALLPARSQNLPSRELQDEMVITEDPPTYEKLLIDGMYLKLSGGIGQAAILLHDCVELDPAAPAAYYELSDVYLMAGDPENMLVNARQAVRHSQEENIWYYLQLAKAYQMNNIPDSAIVMYQNILHLLPGDYDIRLNLSVLHLQSKEYRKALQVLSEMEKQFGPTDEIVITRFQTYVESGKKKSAEKVLLKAIGENPQDPKYYGLMAELKRESGKEDEAAKYYRELMQIDPENDLGFLSMIEFYINTGRSDDAFAEARNMIRSKSIDLDIKIDMYLTMSEDSVFFRQHIPQFNQLATDLYETDSGNYRIRVINVDRHVREQNLEAAAEDLLFVVSKNKVNYYLWEQLLFMLNINNNYEKLFEVSGEAIKLFPDKYTPYFFRGISGLRTDDARLAVDALEKGIRMIPDDEEYLVDFLTLIGDGYNQLEEFSRSDEAFSKALQINPSNPLVLNNYSYYLSLRGEQLEKANEYMDECLRLDPENPTFLDTKAWVLYRMGQPAEARNYLERALSLLDDDHEEISEHYIQILITLGEHEKALEQVRMLIRQLKQDMLPDEKLKEIREKWENQ